MADAHHLKCDCADCLGSTPATAPRVYRRPVPEGTRKRDPLELARVEGFVAGIERCAERVEILSGNPYASSEQSALLRDVAGSLRRLANDREVELLPRRIRRKAGA